MKTFIRRSWCLRPSDPIPKDRFNDDGEVADELFVSNHGRDALQQISQRRFISSKACRHDGIHFGLADVFKINEIASLLGQLGAKEALYATIAFAKGVRCVDFAQEVGQVKISGDRLLDHFQHAQRRGVGLKRIQRFLVGDVRPVAQNLGAGNDLVFNCVN